MLLNTFFFEQLPQLEFQFFLVFIHLFTCVSGGSPLYTSVKATDGHLGKENALPVPTRSVSPKYELLHRESSIEAGQHVRPSPKHYSTLQHDDHDSDAYKDELTSTYDHTTTSRSSRNTGRSYVNQQPPADGSYQVLQRGGTNRSQSRVALLSVDQPNQESGEYNTLSQHISAAAVPAEDYDHIPRQSKSPPPLPGEE